jgi:hypothetical protein
VVAFGDLRGDELVEDLVGFGEAHRVGDLDSGIQCLTAAAAGEGDEVALALRPDGGVIHLVGIAFAEMERGGLEAGCGGCHVDVWLELVCWLG